MLQHGSNAWQRNAPVKVHLISGKGSEEDDALVCLLLTAVAEMKIEVDVFVIGALVAICDLALWRKPAALDSVGGYFVCVCVCFQLGVCLQHITAKPFWQHVSSAGNNLWPQTSFPFSLFTDQTNLSKKCTYRAVGFEIWTLQPKWPGLNYI